MIRNEEEYINAFNTAQNMFDGQIDAADTSCLVGNGDDSEVLDIFTQSRVNDLGLHEVHLTPDVFDDYRQELLGRIVIMRNASLDVLSPVVITADDHAPGVYQLTMLDQPYVPSVGFTTGLHFGLSVKAQTKVGDFGGHNGGNGAFEAGHFSGIVVGARSEQHGDAIAQNGDAGTHTVLDNKLGGVAELMSELDMLDLNYRTRTFRPNSNTPLLVFWDKSLVNEGEPLAADYPDAVKLMLGAGVHAIGAKGLDEARRLANRAVGARIE